MQNDAPITVLIIDDHPLMRDGIAFSLQARADMRVVGQAKDGVEGLPMYALFGRLRLPTPGYRQPLTNRRVLLPTLGVSP